MDIRKPPELASFFFWRRIAQKIPAADLRTGKIFQQIRFPERGMKLDMKMKSTVFTAIGRCLVKWHNIGKRHLPQIIEFDQHALQDIREVADLTERKRRDTR